MEHIGSFDCLRSSLFIAENEIHPLVEMGRHVIALQGTPMQPNKRLHIRVVQVIRVLAQFNI